jgi:hypothetical protein
MSKINLNDVDILRLAAVAIRMLSLSQLSYAIRMISGENPEFSDILNFQYNERLLDMAKHLEKENAKNAKT